MGQLVYEFHKPGEFFHPHPLAERIAEEGAEQIPLADIKQAMRDVMEQINTHPAIRLQKFFSRELIPEDPILAAQLKESTEISKYVFEHGDMRVVLNQLEGWKSYLEMDMYTKLPTKFAQKLNRMWDSSRAPYRPEGTLLLVTGALQEIEEKYPRDKLVATFQNEYDIRKTSLQASNVFKDELYHPSTTASEPSYDGKGFPPEYDTRFRNN